MFKWSDESIRWYHRAVAVNTFFSDVAEEIKAYFDEDDSICDIGCGLGTLSLELARHVKKVTAVDVEKKVLDVLKSDMERRRIQNIDILHTCWEALSGRTWDIVTACNFGNIPSQIPLFMELCNKRCILILRVNNAFNIRKVNISSIKEYLESKGYCYAFTQRQTEFGQLFASREEAMRFFIHYSRIPEAGSEAFLKENLVPAACKEYPLFYPCQSTTSIFVIEKNARPHTACDRLQRIR